MAITMQLGGVNIGQDFPRFSRAAEFIRADDQGPAYKKMNLLLAGFLTGINNASVLSAFAALKSTLDTTGSMTTFTYSDGTAVLYNNQPVYIQSYHEPDDEEFARCNEGDYSIELYYFEDATNSASNSQLGITCTYGSYTFDRAPKWGRSIKPNRETWRATNIGSTATITLSGYLFGTGNADLQPKIDALQNAFASDRLLTYGAFSQNCRVMGSVIAPVVINNQAPFEITLNYDIGSEVRLRRKVSSSRLHQNPVITEQPFCDRRVVQLMNFSAQTVTYKLQVAAADLSTARQLLTTEVLNLLTPGGVELPGGTEDWDYDDVSVDVTIIKFYDPYVLDNLPGTGY